MNKTQIIVCAHHRCQHFYEHYKIRREENHGANRVKAQARPHKAREDLNNTKNDQRRNGACLCKYISREVCALLLLLLLLCKPARKRIFSGIGGAATNCFLSSWGASHFYSFPLVVMATGILWAIPISPSSPLLINGRCSETKGENVWGSFLRSPSFSLHFFVFF